MDSYFLVQGRKSNVVKEVDMIKKKRDERRVKNAELKQKKNEVISKATPPMTTPFFLSVL